MNLKSVCLRWIIMVCHQDNHFFLSQTFFPGTFTTGKIRYKLKFLSWSPTPHVCLVEGSARNCLGLLWFPTLGRVPQASSNEPLSDEGQVLLGKRIPWSQALHCIAKPVDVFQLQNRFLISLLYILTKAVNIFLVGFANLNI